MAPRLDLAYSARPKAVVAPPRINLRRAASYNHQDCAAAPLSSTSSRFNFNHLLFSPPPSPSLPALVARHKRSPSQIFPARPRRLLRLVLCLATLAGTLYACALAFDGVPLALPRFGMWPDYGTPNHDVLPDFPTPIAVRDGRGRSRWTVSIPHVHDFPLSLNEYASMGGRCREVSAHARELAQKPALPTEAALVPGNHDHEFVDVDDAEKKGLLPGLSRGPASKRSGHFVGLDWEAMAGRPICESSLTYVMESPDAGLGGSLMAAWTLYALAREQGRAFFIDDSRWAYGAYTDVFEAPPMPDCRPPPRHHMIPCPAQARHLVVSGGTAKDALPALLATHRRRTGARGTQRDLLQLARTGYEALFKLNGGDRAYVDRRIKEIRARAGAKAGDAASHDAPIIGLHIRRGDRHPHEYQYRDTYIPAEVFAGHAHRLADSLRNDTKAEGAGRRAVVVIASDDPAVMKEAGLADALPAQQRIRLATKELAEKGTRSSGSRGFREEAQGWEGGFFAPMFWNLGAQRRNNAEAKGAPGDGPTPAPAPSEQTLQLRTLIGRAYAMDLAVLAGVSDRLACAVSATGCKLLGVMMGWERAMDRGAWVNVDGEYGWSGLSW